jgi:hypothetical protein
MSEETKTETSPLRLYVYFAKNCAKAAVLVRYEKRKWRLFNWDLKEDSFQDGQWFEGKILPGESSLSGNGTFFRYQARHCEFLSKGCDHITYDIISLVPYLKPLQIKSAAAYTEYSTIDELKVDHRQVNWQRPKMYCSGMKNPKIPLVCSSYKHPQNKRLYSILNGKLYNRGKLIKDFAEPEESTFVSLEAPYDMPADYKKKTI